RGTVNRFNCCAIIRPPRDGGIRYRGLTQEQVQILPVDYEIEYICRGNRVIVGPKVRKCLANGTWTDMTLPSTCLLLCPRVWTSLENGRVTANPPGPPVEGTALHYSCHAGFILEGRNISHCTKLGKWDAPKPTCLLQKAKLALTQVEFDLLFKNLEDVWFSSGKGPYCEKLFASQNRNGQGVSILSFIVRNIGDSSVKEKKLNQIFMVSSFEVTHYCWRQPKNTFLVKKKAVMIKVVFV
uniref:Sushi domain-containing protein n=1 Tax=Oryzias latipes TaxID=8090 RepID=A0A3P9KX97_ORYLA